MKQQEKLGINMETVNPNIYNKEQWDKVRLVVKTQHMKDYPKDFVTDMEADRSCRETLRTCSQIWHH